MTALAKAQTSPKILIADDDPAVVKLLATRCEKMGFQIDTATNGMQMLIKARRNEPDVLIVDVNMPKLDGLNASERLLDPGGRSFDVVLITGSSNPETMERCESLGMFYSRKGPGFWKQIEAALTEIFPQMADTIARHVQTPSAEDATVPERPRVLIVDDDPEVGTYLASRLEKFGVETIYAPNAVQGYRQACKRHPSVIVTDYEMPDGDAHYLLSRLRSTPATEKIPVFVLSGKKIDDATEQNLKREILGQMGALKVLKKSYDVKELFQALQEFCAFENRSAAG